MKKRIIVKTGLVSNQAFIFTYWLFSLDSCPYLFLHFLKLDCFTLQVIVKPNFSIFLTICSNGQNFELPPEVRALFRSVAMVMPDTSLILRAHCAGQGFKSPKILADRLKLVGDICKEQL